MSIAARAFALRMRTHIKTFRANTKFNCAPLCAPDSDGRGRVPDHTPSHHSFVSRPSGTMQILAVRVERKLMATPLERSCPSLSRYFCQKNKGTVECRDRLFVISHLEANSHIRKVSSS